MESLFELRYVLTPETYRDFFRWGYFYRPASLALNIFCIIFFLFELILLVLRQGYNLFYMLFFLLVPVLRVFGYYRALRLMGKRLLEINQEPPISEILLYSDHLIDRVNRGSNCEEKYLEYQNIKCVYELRRTILILTNAKLVFILPKDAFVKGDAESLAQYFLSRGIRVSTL